jgi:hypothetical protein
MMRTLSISNAEDFLVISCGKVICAAKDETSVEFMRPLLNPWAECSVINSC